MSRAARSRMHLLLDRGEARAPESHSASPFAEGLKEKFPHWQLLAIESKVGIGEGEVAWSDAAHLVRARPGRRELEYAAACIYAWPSDVSAARLLHELAVMLDACVDETNP